MANPSVPQALDIHALIALVAYHLHAAGETAQYEDFTQNPGAAFYERMQERCDIHASPETWSFVNGLSVGFDLGLEAAIAVASSPLSPHVDEMRAILDRAADAVASFNESNKAPAAV